MGWFFQIRIKKSFKTRPNTPYGGETSHYSLLQGGLSTQDNQTLALFIWSTIFRKKFLPGLGTCQMHNINMLMVTSFCYIFGVIFEKFDENCQIKERSL